MDDISKINDKIWSMGEQRAEIIAPLAKSSIGNPIELFCIAKVIAFKKSSNCLITFRKLRLRFAQNFSMGFKSGE